MFRSALGLTQSPPMVTVGAHNGSKVGGARRWLLNLSASLYRVVLKNKDSKSRLLFCMSMKRGYVPCGKTTNYNAFKIWSQKNI
jgi:hypothetical protein